MFNKFLIFVMTKRTSFLFFLVLIFFNLMCQAQNQTENIILKKELNSRFEQFLKYPLDSVGFPRSMSVKTGVIKKVPSKDWTSGFFVGSLWQLYTITDDSKYKEYAIKWIPFLEKEKFNSGTHDMGFKIYSSFGKGYEITQSDEYKKVIIKSAQTLCTRFNKKIKHKLELYNLKLKYIMRVNWLIFK